MMKKTYIRPELCSLSIAPATIIAASIAVSNETVVTNPDDAAVKESGNWDDIWD